MTAIIIWLIGFLFTMGLVVDKLTLKKFFLTFFIWPFVLGVYFSEDEDEE